MARPPSTRGSPRPALRGRAAEAKADAVRAPATERDLPPTTLAAAQKRYLRSLAHDLKPVILVGAKGVTPALLGELEVALERHELVKLKIAAGDREERDGWVSGIVEASRAGLVQRVGNVATLFRARRKDPGIVLPR